MNARPGRNDPCPCGSGKKHKHCCGGLVAQQEIQPLIQSGSQDHFRLALDLHRRSRFDEAEAEYRMVLAQQPQHVQALHNLGLLAGQTMRPALAVELLSQVVALQSDDANALKDLGMAMLRR